MAADDLRARNKNVVRRWIAFANAGFPAGPGIPGGPAGLDAFIAAGYVGHLGAATMGREEATPSTTSWPKTIAWWRG